jgi:hypothetical protein
MEKRRLQIWMGAEPDALPEEADKPTLTQLSYKHPNLDQSNKGCGNCAFFKPEKQQCLVHDVDVVVQSTMLCTYYVFGTSGQLPEIQGVFQPLDPEFSGLHLQQGDELCRSCRFFESQTAASGVCTGAEDFAGGSPPVQPLARCNRWETH